MSLTSNRAATIAVFIAAAAFLPSGAGQSGSIYHVERMNAVQIRELDRNRTAVLLPGGILEEQAGMAAPERTGLG